MEGRRESFSFKLFYFNVRLVTVQHSIEIPRNPDKGGEAPNATNGQGRGGTQIDIEILKEAECRITLKAFLGL